MESVVHQMILEVEEYLGFRVCDCTLLCRKYSRKWKERIGAICVQDILVHNPRKRDSLIAERRRSTMSLENGYPLNFIHLTIELPIDRICGP